LKRRRRRRRIGGRRQREVGGEMGWREGLRAVGRDEKIKVVEEGGVEVGKKNGQGRKRQRRRSGRDRSAERTHWGASSDGRDRKA
jgi:hypothetical protein